ncbi:MAG: hypothetical protein KDI44_16570 [Thiothrix sp.]|nr:hypothetical protein [Thiothrix sp.]HPQ96608.1 hypothetical protein [Thiolinea sp.]
MKENDDYYRTQFRIPADIYGEIKDLADENDRSINGQLVYLLRVALGQVPVPVPEDRMKTLIREVVREELGRSE